MKFPDKGKTSNHSDMADQRAARLIARHIAGVISEAEQAELDSWRREDPSHEHVFIRATSVEYVGEQTLLYSTIDTERALSGMTFRKTRRINLNRFGRVAAAVLIPLLTLSLVFTIYRKPTEESGLADYMKPVVRAELITEESAGASTSRGSISGSVFIQEGIQAEVRDGVISWKEPTVDETAPEEAPKTHILKVPFGEQVRFRFSDGSLAVINSGSELRFPSTFTDGQRKIELTGEAFFEVTHDPEKPFIVDLGHSQVKVLGTKFNISSYSDQDNSLTTLTEGMVLVSSGSESVILNPGQQAVRNVAGGLQSRNVDTHVYTSWTEGMIAFENERLEDIMKKLTRAYDLTIIWENQQHKDLLFSGKMKRYKDFSKITHIIERTGNIEFHADGKTVFIR